MLTPITDISHIARGSHQAITVSCDCGRTRAIEAKKYFAGQATCGKCSYRSREYWLEQQWGNLRLNVNQDLPLEWPPISHKIFKFTCGNCGKIYEAPFSRLSAGRAVTCGRCNDLPISKLLSETWGSLRLYPKQKLPPFLSLKSNKEFKFVCSCENSTVFVVNVWAVTSGNTTTCGKCSEKPTSYWLNQSWKNTKLVYSPALPPTISEGTHTKYDFICGCTRVFSCEFKSVINGNTTTCGKCSWKAKNYWLEKRWGRLTLDPNQVLPDEWAPWSLKKFYFLCQCSPDRVTRKRIAFGYAASDGLLSCGCIKIGMSEFSPAGEITTFIKSLTHELVLSNDREALEGKELDIYIPSLKLAIEHHGLIWHCEMYRSGKPDFEKLQLCREKGIRLIQVYEDEWEQIPQVIKAQLQELISPLPKARIKPTFEIFTKTPPEARTFLDSHHYLGAASGCLTVVAKHKQNIVGVWVFQKRMTGEILWHRACWNHQCRSWNPHEKALHLAIPALVKMGFTKMVTFADNRFHTGEMYEKLGFQFETEIVPNYYYTDGKTRKTKYSMRVKAGINEVDAAAKQGWYRIYDSGKKRFTLNLG
jgi:predicted SprT family Zn-dependent metalloprotease